MRLPLVVATISLLVTPALAQEARIFKDWHIGCDNLRNCVALGVPSSEGDAGAFVKVMRSGAPDAVAAVSFAVYADSDKTGSTLALAFDDTSAGGLPANPLPLKYDGSFFRADLSPEAARDFLGALNKAQTLTLTVLGGDGKPDADVTAGLISLAGASAALLFMDDTQKRVGTVTALRSPGDKPASTIPAPPMAPVVNGIKLSEVDPPPALPAALRAKKPDDDSGCSNTDNPPIAIKLSDTAMLWGLCSSTGAYNFSYDFWLVENGKARPAIFPLPRVLGKSSSSLTNPALSDDGRSLSEFNKGRGVGDCGFSDAWAWDGRQFLLADYSEMEDCLGVPPDDWPVYYHATIR